MKATTLPAVNAALVGAGVQTCLTFAKRPDLEAGERLAIHAGASAGPLPAGGRIVAWDGVKVATVAIGGVSVEVHRRAIVASAVVEAVVVIERYPSIVSHPHVVGHGEHLWTVPGHRPLNDQLPFADFTPGRWAVLLTDVARTEDRCPACWGSGHTGELVALCGRTDNGSDGPCVLGPHADNSPCYGEGDVASDWSPAFQPFCPACLNYPTGTCPPIPARGRPGIWRWEP